MALSAKWIDIIFARMQARYGATWARQWEGVDPKIVRADWAHELDGLTEDLMFYGLRFLPADFPPNVTQFRAQCLRRPVPAESLIEHEVRADKRRVEAELSKMNALREKLSKPDPLAWAYQLQDMDSRGESLTNAQRVAYMEALRSDSVTLMYAGFKPVPVETWPPDMREEYLRYNPPSSGPWAGNAVEPFDPAATCPPGSIGEAMQNIPPPTWWPEPPPES